MTFNRRAAEELTERTAAVLGQLGLPPDAVRVRTFHALAREILVDAGVPVEPLVDRAALLRDCFPTLHPEERQRLDDAISRLKLDHDVDRRRRRRRPGAVAPRAGLPPLRGGRRRARRPRLRRPRRSGPPGPRVRPALLDRWRRRCRDLLVDEVQDVDRAQLRLALLLAAPANRAFFVGDDDQTIYAWRLADVRRVLDLDRSLPGLRRVALATNYRCPAVVVERAVRLVERNAERFPKRIRARPGAEGRLVLAPIDGDAERRDDGRRRRSSMPGTPRTAPTAVGPSSPGRTASSCRRSPSPWTAVSRSGSRAWRARSSTRPSARSSPPSRAATRTSRSSGGSPPPRPASREGPGRPRGSASTRRADLDDPSARTAEPPDADEGRPAPTGLVQAVLGWAARFDPGDGSAFVAAVRDRRDRLVALRRDDARLTLSTVHGVKGLEFDFVAVIGLSADGFPNARSVAAALEPERALEEERRLAYVAWTRARRSLTLVFDPARPSPFLLEAFDPAELGLAGAGRPA
ncbi:MAG: hypothetical protein KatS3mg065_0583 [Chloroflexota bacterium]|nr:MAG: hypothetical protein KatS3mg065_0583 [Chloroflexota bacterium]